VEDIKIKEKRKKKKNKGKGCWRRTIRMLAIFVVSSCKGSRDDSNARAKGGVWPPVGSARSTHSLALILHAP
jgi:hypothetical protein